MALLVAMTLGVLALMVLDNEPIRPVPPLGALLPPPPAGAAEVVYDTRVAVRPNAWRYVVVHASPRRSDGMADRCHFIVESDGNDGWRVSSTGRWLNQRPGEHVGGPWADSSIGICLIGDFSVRRPPAGQFKTLMELVNTLQEICEISADRVYLHSDLVAGSSSPGKAFPASEFSARLLRPQR